MTDAPQSVVPAQQPTKATSPIGQSDVAMLQALAEALPANKTKEMLLRVIAACPYLTASPAPSSWQPDEDHPDCATPRECELYDALMGLASHATAFHDDYKQWTQGGVTLEPIVSRALRLDTSSLPATDRSATQREGDAK